MSKNATRSEAEFLADYDTSRFERPNVSVDAVILTVIDDALHVLTLKRDEHPAKGSWSLVGGYVDIHADQDLAATAKRKLEEKTGVKTPYIEQFGAVGNGSRDPRGWSVTVVYYALISAANVHLQAGKGATEIRWARVVDGKVEEELAFDHASLLLECVKRLKSKVLYTSLPVYLMPHEFTLGELQRVYEIILNDSLDHKSFRRRMLAVELLEESGNMRSEGTRPAKLYVVKQGLEPHFFTRTMEASL
jgi:8-oxo-dGTP diphosphatase